MNFQKILFFLLSQDPVVHIFPMYGVFGLLLLVPIADILQKDFFGFVFSLLFICAVFTFLYTYWDKKNRM